MTFLVQKISNFFIERKRQVNAPISMGVFLGVFNSIRRLEMPLYVEYC
jgi:hypothetical protein